MASEIKCPICYEPLSDRRPLETRCNHSFHTDCLLEWVISGSGTREKCPCCREWLVETSTSRENEADENDQPQVELFIEHYSGWKIWGSTVIDAAPPFYIFTLRAPDSRIALGRLFGANEGGFAGRLHRDGYTHEDQIPDMLTEVLNMIIHLPRMNIRSPVSSGLWELNPVEGRETEEMMIFEQRVQDANDQEGAVVVGPYLWQENDWREDFEKDVLKKAPPFGLHWTDLYSNDG